MNVYEAVKAAWTAAGVSDHSDPKSFQAARKANPELYKQTLAYVTLLRKGGMIKA